MTRSILLTGASGGLGQAIAKRLAQSGFSLVLHYHQNASAAHRLLEQLGQLKQSGQTAQRPQHRCIQFSASDRHTCQATIEADISAHGAYYGVVCNAGIVRDYAFPAMPEAAWDSVLQTNLDSFYNVLQPTIMPMIRKRQGGRIITIASVSGIMGNRGQTNYSAAKGGLIAASKSLALELAKRKITVNCVAPGIIATDMTADFDAEKIRQIVPLQRAGTAEEVASAVNFLASDEAAYITRQVLSINGGMC